MATDIQQDDAAALNALTDLSNEGRWGPEDERGALNLVTPDAVRRAAQLVKEGRVYPLGELIGRGSPAVMDRPEHTMRINPSSGTFKDPVQSATDGINLSYIHGSVTHVDALCHIGGTDRKLYNGFEESVVDEHGAHRLGVENIQGLVTRGLLLDIAGLKGVDALPGEHIISEGDLVEAAEAAGIEIEAGDAVLVRTGYRRVAGEDHDRYREFQPGIGASAALHLVRKEVCLIGSDTIAVEAMNLRPDAATTDARAIAGRTNRLHPLLLRRLGIYLLEILNLDELAKAGVTEFQFCLSPLLIEGGTASPVNPLAIC